MIPTLYSDTKKYKMRFQYPLGHKFPVDANPPERGEEVTVSRGAWYDMYTIDEYPKNKSGNRQCFHERFFYVIK